MCRFLKFIPSEEAFWLMKNKPNAFLLLSHIANTARRTLGNPDGLLIGQCHLQHWTFYGFTEREYRTAKEILVQRKHIKIIETNRTRQKSTTGTTTKSTLVEICSSIVYDINPETNDDQNDDRATTDRRLTDDKQERIRKNKKEKEELPQTPPLPVPQKIKFRELVELTQKEYDSLLAKHGQEFLDHMLDFLDSRKGSKGYKYASDFHTMKEGGWVVKETRKELLEQKKSHEKNCQHHAPGSSKFSEPKFQSGRVLRGSNNNLEGNQGSLHE